MIDAGPYSWPLLIGLLWLGLAVVVGAVVVAVQPRRRRPKPLTVWSTSWTRPTLHRIPGTPLLFLAVVVTANAATSALGVVTWLGIAATAGTWLAGFAFVARDSVHELLGTRWVVGCILAGAAISAIFSPQLALASGVAFLLSEFADFAIYAPLRRRGRTRAALASNVVGAVVDSAVFLLIAGFPLALIWGQVGIKVATTSAFVLAWGSARALLRQPVHAESAGRHA